MYRIPLIRSIKNQYRGINAHLHSLWQAEGGWHEFHTSHIVHLATLLRMELMPLGYTAGIEPSLQIRRLDEISETPGRPKADVALYDTHPVRPFLPVGGPVTATGQVTLGLSELLAQEKEITGYRALRILQLKENGERGEPVAWIEILSPSNKRRSQDFLQYREKRLQLLESGLVFVELDYLHETPPTFTKFANYAGSGRDPRPEMGSHPYRIIVIDPRPTFGAGKAYNYEFDVDDPLPTVEIPLNSDDKLAFDFGLPYRKTLEETLFAYEFVDYSQLPINFERYNAYDQTRIAKRMVAVLQAHHTGLDLEKELMPTAEITLHEALTQIVALTRQP